MYPTFLIKVPVITVCYNSEKYISDAFDSVFRQGYDNVEYLVVDGASSDGTISIVKKYSKLVPGRMRWVSEHDQGLYDAMNKGIKMATGDIVGILNSDDF